MAISDVAKLALISVLDAQETYRSRYHRYASLADLGPARAGLISQELADQRTRLFRLNLENYSDETFAITVVPQKRDNPITCFAGCPLWFNFYADQTRIVRYNNHCRAATATSAISSQFDGVFNRLRR